MPPEARAKQFMPFAALKGFEEALSLQENVRQQKAALDEEEIEKINRQLMKLTAGDSARLVYFYQGRYTPLNGRVQAIDANRQFLEMDGKRVYFDDILKFYDDER